MLDGNSGRKKEFPSLAGFILKPFLMAQPEETPNEKTQDTGPR